ncbi:hypothetical protein ABH927_000775 [Planotetraspora sp. GP83]
MSGTPGEPDKRADFETGWWTFIGGPFLVIRGAHDLIISNGWWGYASGIFFLFSGSVLWWGHGKIVWAHIRRSRQARRRPDL